MSRLTLWPISVVFIFLTALYLLFLQHDDVSGRLPLARLRMGSVQAPASRLNLTLAGNELRYQEAVRERRISIAERIGGPDMPAFPAPFSAFYTLWDLFIPAFSCPFSATRVGTMGDGGKWVCGLERVVQQPKCLIYSMGVERQSSFEQAILHQSEHCQVYGFDFSVSQWGPDLQADTEQIKSRAHFFPWKIGGVDNPEANPKEYSLQGIMKELGHDFVDIWKIDIEGSEFSALTAIIESFKERPLPFGQMQIEIHIGYVPDTNTIGAIDKWWSMLEDAGLRPFWTELNLLDVNVLRRGPPVAEVSAALSRICSVHTRGVQWSFINIRGKHALLDDSLPDYP
ncbi:methyltransferase domain-containing protein [Mycena haematopus]|nr:methyltransferase domain-containing protein [Mycena haematopus]